MVGIRLIKHLRWLMYSALVTAAAVQCCSAQEVSDKFIETYRAYDKAFTGGDLEEAVKLAEETLRLGIAEIGADHEKTAILEINLGHALLRARRFEEAEPHLLKAKDIYTARTSETDTNLLTVYQDLALLRWAQGQFGKARLYFSRALNVLKTNNGVDDPQIASVLLQVANFESNIGELPKAQSALKRAYELRKKTLDERHPLMADIVFQQGAVAMQGNQHKAAERYFLDALRVWQETIKSQSDPRILRAHGSLTIVYEALGNVDRMKFHGDKLVEHQVIEEGEAKPLVVVNPTFPESALQQAREGWVLVEFNVTDEGHVSRPEVVEAQPPDLFDEATLEAVSKWRFKPRVKDGQRVGQANTRVRITLQTDNMSYSFGAME